MEHYEVITSPEFKRFVSEREKEKASKGILLMAAVLAVTLLAYFFSAYPIISVLIGIAAEIYVFLRFCLPRILVLKDTSYEGTVEMVKKKTVSGGKPADAGDVPDRFRVRLKIKDTNGKSHSYTFYNDEADNVKNYFSPGDKVFHHKGIKCPEKADKTVENHVICLCCTRLADKRESLCPICEMPLVK